MRITKELAKNIYNISLILLEKKASDSGVDIDELEWYFDPLSEEHIKMYSRKFALNHEIDFESNDFLFMRFVTSVFNSGYHNDMTNNPNKFFELAKVAEMFDLSQFLDKHNSVESVYNEVINNPAYPELNTLKSKRLIEKMKSLYTIAVYLDTSDLRTIDIKLRKPKGVYGVGDALFCDAVKEAGLLDIAKPDVHIIHVLNAALNKNFDKNALKAKELDEIQDILFQIASYNNVTVYKLDKILWMVSALLGNTFYLHKPINYKHELLSELKSAISKR